MYHPKKLLNRYFVFAWIIGFALHVGQDVFNSCITVFANNKGYSNTFAGSLSMGYLAGALIGRRVGGWVTDLRGRSCGCTGYPGNGDQPIREDQHKDRKNHAFRDAYINVSGHSHIRMN